MAKYLKAIGIIELIGAFCSAIVIAVIAFLHELGGLGFVYFLLTLLFGPALGCLLYSVGQILENTENSYQKLIYVGKKIHLVFLLIMM